ncbi:MAG TPA: peptide-methionine (S)-S-oxide reductase MsrA, partial [Candidatus Paceibacterota bacterium]|nr:peptide-methionine (S)-S-oxide reductase MsrA [Candidatus Paceibacterota bacterium]
MKTAYFAGGCFWCTESDLRKERGVVNVVSGYAGPLGSPTYENHKGFREAVEVTYDEKETTYKKLCQFFLDHIDPTDSGGQFFDRGESYQTAIYFQNNEEKKVAENLIKELDESKIYESPVIVKILQFENFYKAEEYHQQYASKNPGHYEAYKRGSGREEFQAR